MNRSCRILLILLVLWFAGIAPKPARALDITIDPQAESLVLGENTVVAPAGVDAEGRPTRQYVFTAPASGTYSFYSKSSRGYDVHVFLYDAKGRLLASDDDRGGGLQFRINYRLTEGKKYYLLPGYWKEDPAASVKIRLCIETPAPLIESLNRVPLAEKTRKVAFVPKATANYIFTIVNPRIDTTAALYDAQDRKIASDDHSGALGNFRIEQKLEKGKTYYLRYRAKDAKGFTMAELIVARRFQTETKKIRNATLRPRYYIFRPKRTARYIFTTNDSPDEELEIVNALGDAIGFQEHGTHSIIMEEPVPAGEDLFIRTDGSLELTISMDRCTIKNLDIRLDKTRLPADGSPQKPAVTITHDGYTLKRGKEFTVSYQNNVQPGTASATIQGIGAYKGKVVKKFAVVGEQKTQLEKAVVSGIKGRYTFTGKKIRPVPTVTLGETTLEAGVDYTVSYQNNQETGSATVTVKGIGNYTGTITRQFAIDPCPITAARISLSQGTYAYDGTAKTPAVKVRLPGVTLEKDRDYTVSYQKNKKAGTAGIVLKGIGNLEGRTTRNFYIIKKTKFTWGQDNWNFRNNQAAFVKAADGDRKHYRQQISETYLKKLKQNTTNVEWEAVKELLDSRWEGACYGMAVTTLLHKDGLLAAEAYNQKAQSLHDLKKPVSSFKISSLITYYQLLQVKDGIQQQYAKVPYRSNQVNLSAVRKRIRTRGACLVGYEYSGVSHMVLAVGHKTGSWKKCGSVYDCCIVTNDPNSADARDPDTYIYYNSKTFDWVIPYMEFDWERGAKHRPVISYVGADLTEVNDGGCAIQDPENAAARLDARNLSAQAQVSKAGSAEQGFGQLQSGQNEILPRTRRAFAGQAEGVPGFDLMDGKSAYRVRQPAAGQVELQLRYPEQLLRVEAEGCREAVFSPDGYIAVEGKKKAYRLRMTSNEDGPLRWCTITVEGCAEKVSLQRTENGYLLQASNLRDLTIRAENKEEAVSRKVSLTGTSALIFETEDGTIGVSKIK